MESVGRLVIIGFYGMVEIALCYAWLDFVVGKLLRNFKEKRC